MKIITNTQGDFCGISSISNGNAMYPGLSLFPNLQFLIYTLLYMNGEDVMEVMYQTNKNWQFEF